MNMDVMDKMGMIYYLMYMLGLFSRSLIIYMFLFYLPISAIIHDTYAYNFCTQTLDTWARITHWNSVYYHIADY